MDYLEEAGYTAPGKIVQRDRWSTKKKRDYANKIADEMEGNGKIKKLYRDFRDEIDAAREARVCLGLLFPDYTRAEIANI